MEDKELKIYDYTVIGMFLNPEGFFSVKVSLDKKDEHKIILKFAIKLIEDLFKNFISEEEIENKLNIKNLYKIFLFIFHEILLKTLLNHMSFLYFLVLEDIC